MQPLNYESPRPSKSNPLFWLLFAASYLPGLFILNATDDVTHRALTGHNGGDGGVMFLGLYLSPLFAGLAALIRRKWKRYDSPLFAILFPIFAPLLAYFLWVFLSEIGD